MNLKKTILLSFIFVINLQMINAQSKVYDYPIKPGTKEWAELKTGKEMVEVCQIPENILNKIPTSELAYLCMNYPLLFDIMLANNFQEGFENISSSFNGFQELFKREDAGKELFKLYKKFDLVSFNKDKRTKSKSSFLDMYYDIVMAQPIFLEKLNKEEEIELIRTSFDRLKTREKRKESLFTEKTTAVLLSRLMIKNNPKKRNSNKRLALNNYFVLTEESLIEDIKTESENYLKNKK